MHNVAKSCIILAVRISISYLVLHIWINCIIFKKILAFDTIV